MMQSDRKLNWWMRLAWQLYVYLPSAADDIIDRCLRYLAPLARPRVPVAIVRGLSRSDGRPGVVVIAGVGQGIDYLVHRAFEGDPQRELMGKVPPWRLARTLKRLRTSADMSIARVDRITARFLFDSSYLAVPEWVGTLLTLPEHRNAFAAQSDSLKKELQRVLRSNFTSELTRTKKDFEAFYYTMYVPFVRKRHGEQAVVRRFYSMRRLFRHGGLFWIRQSGQRVAGLLFHQQDQTLELVALGTINGEWAPVEAGAFATLYSAFVKHAEAIGCTGVEMGGCRPSLNDGVLRYKRKWGAHLIEQRGSHYDFMVHWHHCSETVIAFLAHTPIIFRDHDGLSAVTAMGPGQATTQTDARKVHGSVWMPGLRRLYLVAASGRRAIRESPLGTVLVDLPDARDNEMLQPSSKMKLGL